MTRLCSCYCKTDLNPFKLTTDQCVFVYSVPCMNNKGGACGYVKELPLFGTATVALSSSLYNNGNICGACFEIQCVNSNACLVGRTTQVTATNLCPSGSDGGWCDRSKQHFDLALGAFVQIGQKVAGEIPIQYRRSVLYFASSSFPWNI